MEYNFKNLVFEGGGCKGIAYGGALYELEKLNILTNIQRVAGTSAGAITAALLSLGYAPIDITVIIGKTDFKKFEDNTFFVLRDVWRLIHKFGWNKGNEFTKWMGELIEAKTGNPNSTFADFKAAGYKDLYVVCTNITQQRADILSFETTPDLSVKEAVRMSMGIPIFFAAVKNKNGDVIVDGAVTWNYPINIFDNVKYLDNPSNGMGMNYDLDPEYIFNYETLGFRVDSNKEVNYSKDNWKTEPIKVKNIKRFVGALMVFMMDMVNKKHLHKNDWNRTVFIDSMDVKTTEFKLSKEKIRDLIENGKIAVKHYFKWKNSDKTWSKIPE
jgi:NTE family protein